MTSYRDKETTTIIATPLEISRLLTDMLREEFVRSNSGANTESNPVILTHNTHTKDSGLSRIVFKLDVQGT